jgi:hypothetical protein
MKKNGKQNSTEPCRSKKNPKNYKKPVKSLRACIKLKKKELNK